MTDLDALFRDANDDLETGLRDVAVPDFTPRRRRSPYVAAVLALVFAIGVGGFLVRGNSTPDTEELVVTTAPDTIAPPTTVADVDSTDTSADETSADETSADETSADETTADETTSGTGVAPTPAPALAPDETPAFEPGEIRQLTAAQPGEFIMPLTFGPAWSPADDYLLLYRSGVNGSAHVIVDAASGDTIAEPDINPRDIEQVWWHPLKSDELIYLADNTLVAWSLATETTSVLRTFSKCVSVDSGPQPPAPTASGFLGILCHRSNNAADESSEPYVVFLNDEVASRPGQGWDVESAPYPAPSGDVVLLPNTFGSLVPFDFESFGMVDVVNEPDWPYATIVLEDDDFTFVTLADGSEAVAGPQYQGDIFGNLVVHPLDGSEPLAILDADAAGGFPAPGTEVHSNTGVGASIVAVSISDRDDESPLAGTLMVFDLAGLDSTDPATLAPIFSVDHGATDRHDYWSTVFVSISPSGRYLTWSSDQGSDSVNTFVVELPT